MEVILIKTKVVLSLSVITMVLILMVGATLAWFTAESQAIENQFVAGTVEIDAGSSVVKSQYFDSSEAVFLYGVEYATGGLYEIDVQNMQAYQFANVKHLGGDTYSPNGLAFDNGSRRLYFAVNKGSNAELWFYDLRNGELVYAGLERNVKLYGATFGRGYYWYVANGTDALYRVSFNADGTIKTSELYDNITSGNLNYGDIVLDIRDGILYGSSSSPQKFFKYYIDDKVYQELGGATALNLQLAFGSDGVLYGHHTWQKNFYSINTLDGSAVNIGNIGHEFNDLASGYISVWNPGDCSRLRYFVRNRGTKKIRVRVSVVGHWEQYIEDSGWENWNPGVNVVTMVPSPADKWKQDGGYIYYKGELGPGDEAELFIQVCLDGPDTGNDFQGKRFVINTTFEAVQSSNEAPLSIWNVTDEF
ncbi:MAG: SipW-dependent-type signal peptide-containing protein, partial [Candidatus Contubernalis sp.]|nr:SipW-dependent-type signal peptide-containing protein [Candidatus Contubernalis sp.]